MILSFSGWGQKFDSLDIIFKDSVFDPSFFKRNPITHFDYSSFKCPKDLFNNVKNKNLDPKIIIGWSLGGQIAMRLISQKILKPKLLILIAPPFQMVKNKQIEIAMSQKTFNNFYQNFKTSPTKTLKQFAVLSAIKDQNSKEIIKNIQISDNNFENLQSWLQELKDFSCFDINFDDFPKTIFFQGKSDMITHPKQVDYFKERIKYFTLELFKNCGHAPHLNDREKFSKILFEHISKFK